MGAFSGYVVYIFLYILMTSENLCSSHSSTDFFSKKKFIEVLRLKVWRVEIMLRLCCIYILVQYVEFIGFVYFSLQLSFFQRSNWSTKGWDVEVWNKHMLKISYIHIYSCTAWWIQGIYVVLKFQLSYFLRNKLLRYRRLKVWRVEIKLRLCCLYILVKNHKFSRSV